MPEISIPEKAEELTAAWLSEALQSAQVLNGAAILAFTMETVGEETGFLGELVRVRPTYEGEAGIASFIVKFPAADPDARATGESLRAFEREAQFYRQFANEPGLGQPRHLFSVCNVEKSEYLVILEDIGHARFVGQMEGANPEDAHNVVAALGHMHGRYWNNPTVTEAAWLPDFSEWAEIYPPEMKIGLPLVQQNFGHILSHNIGSLLGPGSDAYPAIVHAFKGHAKTLVHCDARIENVCFEANNGVDDVRMFDWQLVSCGPGAYDLMYFIAQSLEADVRKEIEADLFRTYLDALKSEGVKGYELSDLKNDLGTSACMMWGFLAMIGTIVKPDEKGMPIVKRTFPRWCSLMEDYDAPDRLQAFL